MVGYDGTKVELSPWESSFAGALAGAVTRFLCQPFDVLKTRFQVQVEPISSGSEISKYVSISQAFSKILSEEGVPGLWKGHICGQFLSISYGLAQFGTFEVMTKVMSLYFPNKARDTEVHMICGVLAGTVATVASFPFDVMRTRFISQGNKKLYYSIPGGYKTMLMKEGVKANFKGLSPTLILTAPQAGLLFGFYNLICLPMKKTSLAQGDELTVVGSLITGCLSGIGAKTVVYPLDLARKRLQLQGFQGRIGFGENFSCKGLYDCLYTTFKGEGFAGLYKGLSPSIIKAGLTTALHFAVYEEIRKFLQSNKIKSSMD